MEKIAVIGCGWLGLPLARELVEDGYGVVGTTTTPEKIGLLRSEGIQPVLLSLSSNLKLLKPQELPVCRIAIVNVPPGRRDPEVVKSYPAKIKVLLEMLSNIELKHIIFTSSTGVYGSGAGLVNENSLLQPDTASGRAVLEAEGLIAQSSVSYTILRIAGLVGGQRQPGRWFSGKENVKGGDTKVNMLHRDDCIGVIKRIISSNRRNEVYNVCADMHPVKKLFYTMQSKRIGEQPATWQKGITGNKVVNSEKLKDHLGYKFVYPDPLYFS